MLDEATRGLITATSERLELSPAVVEKDYYVSHILAVLSRIQNEHSTLVFAGGTCLAKAHHLVNRMSEDVDFKFQRKNNVQDSSKNQYLKTLKVFRDDIVTVLEKTYDIKEVAVRNEGQYLRIQIDYASDFSTHLQLRPHILLEFTASTLRLPTQTLPITTLIQDTLGGKISLFSSSLTCISAEETAAEKWVALTRRVAAMDRGYYKDDKTLIRHVYDLSAILAAQLLNEQFFLLVHQVISNDAKQFKNQHPEYFTNPVKEIYHSLSILKTKTLWEERYDNFLIAMVYDKKIILTYKEALSFLEQLSNEVIRTFSSTSPYMPPLQQS